jgi:5-formyltetrahydrofolate cyclo-ligase
MINLHKSSLRKELLLSRAGHNEYEYIAQNEIILQKTRSLLDVLYLKFKKKSSADLHYEEAENLDKYCGLGLYWPLKGEPDLFKLAISSKWCVGLPKISGNSMKIVRYVAGSRLKKSQFEDLHEPSGDEEIIPKVILIPGLAFSVNGYRLGFGRGYYDKYIAKISQNSEIIKIGVCFHNNFFEYLPYDDHDIKLDYIITDQIFIRL